MTRTVPPICKTWPLEVMAGMTLFLMFSSCFIASETLATWPASAVKWACRKMFIISLSQNHPTIRLTCSSGLRFDSCWGVVATGVGLVFTGTCCVGCGGADWAVVAEIFAGPGMKKAGFLGSAVLGATAACCDGCATLGEAMRTTGVTCCVGWGATEVVRGALFWDKKLWRGACCGCWVCWGCCSECWTAVVDGCWVAAEVGCDCTTTEDCCATVTGVTFAVGWLTCDEVGWVTGVTLVLTSFDGAHSSIFSTVLLLYSRSTNLVLTPASHVQGTMT